MLRPYVGLILFHANGDFGAFYLVFLHKGLGRRVTSDQFSGQRLRLDVFDPGREDLGEFAIGDVPGCYTIFDIEIGVFAFCPPSFETL